MSDKFTRSFAPENVPQCIQGLMQYAILMHQIRYDLYNSLHSVVSLGIAAAFQVKYLKLLDFEMISEKVDATTPD